MEDENKLSQDEINMLINMAMQQSQSDTANPEESEQSDISGNQADQLEVLPGNGSDVSLDEMEIDALGEVGNISMGTAATTLFQLLGQKVLITTPKVTITTWENICNEYITPCIVVEIKYTVGFLGSNLLVLKENDSKIITDLMMGGDGRNISLDPLNELHLSAISEAMNQMVGSSTTSLSSIFNKKIDISPPKSYIYQLATDKPYDNFARDQVMAKIAFKMVIGDLLDSEIMQILPVEFAKEMVMNLMSTMSAPQAEPSVSQAAPQVPETSQAYTQEVHTTSPAATGAASAYQEPVVSQQSASQGYQQTPQFAPQEYQPQQSAPLGHPQQQMPDTQYQAPPLGYPPQYQQSASYPQYQQPPQGYPQYQQMPQYNPVNIQPAQFQSFDDTKSSYDKKNIDLIIDVPLQITVELGRTKKLIKEILEYGSGSLIELDKLAGEPVDILVNGKAVAKGEVVVIDENFAVKITEIADPSQRL